jgi:hypothetical protein
MRMLPMAVSAGLPFVIIGSRRIVRPARGYAQSFIAILKHGSRFPRRRPGITYRKSLQNTPEGLWLPSLPTTAARLFERQSSGTSSSKPVDTQLEKLAGLPERKRLRSADRPAILLNESRPMT